MSHKVRLKSKKDIDELRISGKILASILQNVSTRIKVGTELQVIDTWIRDMLQSHGATSAFLGYRPEWNGEPFPAVVCTSVNDQVVHGIPSKYSLKNGDVLKVDLGVNYHDYITDAAITILVGECSEEAKQITETTKKALEEGVKMCRAGKRLGDVGYTIENVIQKYGFKVLRGLTGHGVGFKLHEEPTVYNYGNQNEGLKMEPGLVVAIEPMASVSATSIREDEDLSFRTIDGSISTHFEKTIAITENNPIILTPWDMVDSN